MTRPPLANLFALYHEDLPALDAAAADLASSGEFAEVWRPAPGWVVAAAPLPGGEADGQPVRRCGLAFAEGRDGVGPPENVGQLVAHHPERLATLPGDFGFVHFTQDGRATVVRSAGGLVPFYWSQSNGRIAVSTRLGDFVRFLDDEPRLDPLVNAVWTTGHGIFPDGRTFLEGVSILRRGGLARIHPGRPTATDRYWDPRPDAIARPTPARFREHATRLRELLIGKLERDLDPDGGNLLTLSGGVDSSALGALAVGVVGRKVWTWSLLPADEAAFQREMRYIQPLAERYHFARRWVVRLEQETRFELLRRASSPVFHVIHPALCDLPRVCREAPVRVLFGGEFADEVCGSVFTFPDWVAHTSASDLLASLNKLPSGPRDVLRWGKRRVLQRLRGPELPFPLELPDFVRPELQEEYRCWLARRRAEETRDGRPLRHLALRTELDGFVAMNWEATSALGVRRSFPFFNREVLELAFECHPAERVGPGTKKLLRSALANDVPASNLGRPDRGHWHPSWARAAYPWTDALPEALRAVVPDRYLTRPSSMDYWQAPGLTQLTAFCKSVQHWSLFHRAKAAAHHNTPQEVSDEEAREAGTRTGE